jgi:hypothetical protein
MPASSAAYTTARVLIEEFKAIHAGKSTPIDLKISNGASLDGMPGQQERNQQLAYNEATKWLADNGAGQSALCLSGGGIRSAAFALGILQGLARHGLLSQFDYLSTVSGGGYIGSWLIAWAHRSEQGPLSPPSFSERIESVLATHGESEPEPLQKLRQTQTFLTPKTGAASPDTWTGIATVFRNLVLNWLVFIPALAALLLVPRLIEAWVLSYAYRGPGRPCYFLNSLLPWVTSCAGPVTHYDVIGAIFVGVGLAFFMSKRPSGGTSDMGDAMFVKWSLLWILAAALFLMLAIAAVNSSSHDHGGTELARWASFGAVIFSLSGTVAFVMGRRSWSGPLGGLRKAQSAWPDLIALAFTGATVGLLIWAGLCALHGVRGENARGVRDIVAFGPPWLLLAFMLSLAVFVALRSRVPAGDHEAANRAERDREWLARTAGWCGATGLAWLLPSVLVLYGPEVLAFFGKSWGLLSVLVLSGAGSVGGGASPLTRALPAVPFARKLPLTAIVSVLSAVFIASLAVLLSASTGWLLAHWFHQPDIAAPLRGDPYFSRAEAHSIGLSRLWVVLVAILVLGVFSLLTSLFVNVNYFSLNALYRFRLVRTFLGASNLREYNNNKEPPANQFDGFRDTDNLVLGDLWKGTAQRVRLGPFLVIGMTLNLVTARNLAWQERKAAPFIATPLHTGGAEVDYRPSADYAGGLTLGTAMSISGAAVSPNWGYHSSPLTSFLMTLFNVRLGAWMGNPRGRLLFRRREPPWRQNRPDSSLRLLWQEALGKTDADSAYIYLSDGGHFDNLGLYEMLRRRCATIVISDAGADPEFKLEDLGNVLRKAAIDLGVTVTFKPIQLAKRGPDPVNPGIYSAVGTIIYPDPFGFKGRIVYIKPGLHSDAPADVRAYAASNAQFPHDTTLNQWFTESQFESYRALGSHAIRIMTGRGATSPLTLLRFVRLAARYTLRFKPAPPTAVRVVT